MAALHTQKKQTKQKLLNREINVSNFFHLAQFLSTYAKNCWWSEWSVSGEVKGFTK